MRIDRKLITASNKWSFPIIRTNIVILKSRFLFSKRILRYKRYYWASRYKFYQSRQDVKIWITTYGLNFLLNFKTAVSLFFSMVSTWLTLSFFLFAAVCSLLFSICVLAWCLFTYFLQTLIVLATIIIYIEILEDDFIYLVVQDDYNDQYEQTQFDEDFIPTINMHQFRGGSTRNMLGEQFATNVDKLDATMFPPASGDRSLFFEADFHPDDPTNWPESLDSSMPVQLSEISTESRWAYTLTKQAIRSSYLTKWMNIAYYKRMSLLFLYDDYHEYIYEKYFDFLFLEYHSVPDPFLGKWERLFKKYYVLPIQTIALFYERIYYHPLTRPFKDDTLANAIGRYKRYFPEYLDFPQKCLFASESNSWTLHDVESWTDFLNYYDNLLSYETYYWDIEYYPRSIESSKEHKLRASWTTSMRHHDKKLKNVVSITERNIDFKGFAQLKRIFHGPRNRIILSISGRKGIYFFFPPS
jgi:hypothetical protein